MIKYFAIISLCLASTSAIDYTCHYILDPKPRASDQWCQENCFDGAGQLAPACLPNSKPHQVCSCDEPSPQYSCDQTTYQCQKSKNGISLKDCKEKCTPPQYSCDETTYQCVQSRNGISLKDCNEKCQKPFSAWRCDPQTQKCVGDDEHGAYIAHKGCDYICQSGYFKTSLNFSDVGENFQWVEIVVTRDSFGAVPEPPKKGGKVVQTFQIPESSTYVPILYANSNLTFWYKNHDGEYSISQNHYSCWAEKGCIWYVGAQAPDNAFGSWSFSWPQGQAKSFPYKYIVLTTPNTTIQVYKCKIDGTEVCSEWWTRKFDQYFQDEQGKLKLWLSGFYAPKGGKKCQSNSLAFEDTVSSAHNQTANHQHQYPKPYWSDFSQFG